MATTAQIADFRAAFPEFDDTDDSLVSRAIDLALTFVDECTWGVRYALGWQYLAAHFLTIAIRQAEGDFSQSVGSPKEIVAGRVKVSFNTNTAYYNTADDALLIQTSYGAMYLTMRNALVIHIFSYGDGCNC